MMKKPTGKSASDLVERAAGLMAEAQERTVKEVRYYLALSMLEAATDASLEKCVREDTDDPEFELSPAFVAGVRYAAKHMVGNEQFDY